MSGSNDGSGSKDGSKDGSGSRGSRFLKLAGAAATTAAVVGGLYAVLSSSSAAPELEVPFGAKREVKEHDDGGPLKSFCDAPLILHVEEGDPLRWKKPEIGWVKLNVDGSRDHHKILSAGCGGVLRDPSGEWLHGFVQKLNPIYEAPQIELQAILTGLELASKMELEKLVVESDCDSALSMLKKGVKRNHEDYDVVEGIRRLCFDLNWEVRLVSIAKKPNQKMKSKANVVADKLANYARVLPSYDLCEYRVAPDYCTELLKNDISNDGSGSKDGSKDGSESWGLFLKVAGAAAATVAVGGALVAALSSSSSAYEQRVALGAQHEDEKKKRKKDRKKMKIIITDSEGKKIKNKSCDDQEKWKKPEIGSWKLNVDGSLDHNGPSAGCGGVLRDSSGKWLLGFSMNLDPKIDNQAHKTELQAILMGLKLATEMNVKKPMKLVVESDSESVVRMVENGLKDKHPEFDIVQRIKDLREGGPAWQVNVVCVPRTANRVANWLANDARKLSFYTDPLNQYDDIDSVRRRAPTCYQIWLEDNEGF